MMGSETFIMVHLRCSESSASSALACGHLLGEEGAGRPRSSPSVDDLARQQRHFSFSTVTAPSASDELDAHVGGGVHGRGRLAAVEVLVAHVGDAGHRTGLGQSFIILWGCFWANFFTDTAGRRSELPSRSTGFTAEPSTTAKRACRARSSSLDGSSG